MVVLGMLLGAQTKEGSLFTFTLSRARCFVIALSVNTFTYARFPVPMLDITFGDA